MLITSGLLLAVPGEAVSFKSQKFLGFPSGTKGIGFLLGEPTAVRGNYFLNWKRNLSFTAGYSFSQLYLASADYLFYFYSEQDRMRYQDFFNSLFFYMGPGVIAGTSANNDPNNSLVLGGRAVVGSEYLFERSHWSLRLELALNAYLKGNTAFGGQGVIGLTYYIFPERQRPHFKKANEGFDPWEFD